MFATTFLCSLNLFFFQNTIVTLPNGRLVGIERIGYVKGGGGGGGGGGV